MAAVLSSSNLVKAAGSWKRTSSREALAVMTPSGLKPGGRVSQMHQGANEQSGGGEQHDSERDLAGDQCLAHAVAAYSGYGAA